MERRPPTARLHNWWKTGGKVEVGDTDSSPKGGSTERVVITPDERREVGTAPIRGILDEERWLDLSEVIREVLGTMKMLKERVGQVEEDLSRRLENELDWRWQGMVQELDRRDERLRDMMSRQREEQRQEQELWRKEWIKVFKEEKEEWYSHGVAARKKTIRTGRHAEMR